MNTRIQDFYKEELEGKESEFNTEIMVITGQIEEVILETAKKENADLIVMGSRTHSVVGRMMMGSSANKVVHTSEIPVLVVPIHN